jgi:hypothetical protein
MPDPARWLCAAAAGVAVLLASACAAPPAAAEAVLAERIDIDASIGQFQQAPPLRDVPVAVLSKTEPFGGLPPTIPGDLTGADVERIWPQVQTAVVAIRPQTPQTLVHQPDVLISSTDLIVGRAAAPQLTSR